MTFDEAKTVIVKKVNEMKCCKMMEFLTENEVYSLYTTHHLDVPELIDELIQDKKIVEISYIFEEDNKYKVLLFPTGTVFALRQHDIGAIVHE